MRHSLTVSTNILIVPFFLVPLLLSSSDIQKKQPDEDCAPKPAPASGSSQSAVFSSESSTISSQSLSSQPSGSDQPPSDDPLPVFSGTQEGKLVIWEKTTGLNPTEKLPQLASLTLGPRRLDRTSVV